VIKQAKNEAALFKRHTILFLDEVHRFNKAQQDAFLPHIEAGVITFIGATTENPSFRQEKKFRAIENTSFTFAKCVNASVAKFSLLNTVGKTSGLYLETVLHFIGKISLIYLYNCWQGLSPLLHTVL
jgi:hypothetical protein